MDRHDLQGFFEQRRIDARHVPSNVLARARKIVERLERGESYLTFHGKRLSHNRWRVSIPLGRRWRILAEDVDGQLQVRSVLSHQTYNASLKII